MKIDELIANAIPILKNTGIVKKDALLTCFSITGYSGGGKKMIADMIFRELNQRLQFLIDVGLEDHIYKKPNPSLNR